MNKKILVYILLFAAFIERVYVDFGPNVELITLAMIASYFVFGSRKSLIFTFSLLVISDLVIGNTNIFVFTWSGFLIPILFFRFIRTNHKVLTGTLLGVSFNLFFFVWTNFGVWYLDSWNMYSDGFTGLINSYISGLPFLKLHFTSTLLTVPVGIWMVENWSVITSSSRSCLRSSSNGFRLEPK